MEISGSKQLPVSRKEIWDALHNAELLTQLIDGCKSLEWTSDTTLVGSVASKIGPVKAAFKIELEISNSIPLESYTISGEAKSKAQGFAGGSANVRLADTDDGCEIHYDADVKIGGKIAQLGSRLMKGVSKKIVDGFFDKLVVSLSPESETEQQR